MELGLSFAAHALSSDPMINGCDRLERRNALGIVKSLRDRHFRDLNRRDWWRERCCNARRQFNRSKFCGVPESSYLVELV